MSVLCIVERKERKDDEVHGFECSVPRVVAATT